MAHPLELFIKHLMASRDLVRLYTLTHPEFRNCVARAYNALQPLFNENTDIVIGIVGNEFAYRTEIFFTLSEQYKTIIASLKDRGIERIVFSQGITVDELITFVAFLRLRQEDVPADMNTYLREQGAHHIRIGKIGLGSSGLEESVPDDTPMTEPVTAASSTAQLSSSIDGVLDGSTIPYDKLKGSLASVMTALLEQSREFLSLSTVKRYDVTTFTHMMSVAVLSMYTAAKLGYDHDDVTAIGIAGLFHDIGKLYISRKILSKPDGLTDKEFAQIRSHTILGAELMLEHVDALGQLPVIVAYEHHTKYTRDGYPKLAPGHTPHPISLLVAVCDVYDALMQRRSYKRDYAPEIVYDLMIKGRGTMFHPELFDAFFDIIGVWPLGTIVALSNGGIAIVREIHRGVRKEPVIDIIESGQIRERIDLATTRSITIVRSLNPLEEGKEYKQLI